MKARNKIFLLCVTIFCCDVKAEDNELTKRMDNELMNNILYRRLRTKRDDGYHVKCHQSGTGNIAAIQYNNERSFRRSSFGRCVIIG